MRDESPSLRWVPADNLDIAVWEWPGEDPPLVFAHATGFHGRSWDSIARQFAGRRRLAVDFRGHGRSGQPRPPVPWRAFGRDLVAVAERMEVTGALGIGHSLGGHALVSAIAARPATFGALLLIDPVILPWEFYDGNAPDSSFIARRRERWSSPDEMFQRFRTRRPFATWQPEILRDYCEFALLPQDGGFALACPPELEASIYNQARASESNLYPEIAGIAQPVVVMRAGGAAARDVLELNASPTAPDLAARFLRGRDVLLPGRSHFIPMECPELVADEIRSLMFALHGEAAVCPPEVR